MQSKPSPPATIDEYIAGFPAGVQDRLRTVRAAVRQAAPPEAEETIRYGMPTFTLNGRYLIYFAAHKKHISLYPAPTGVPEFAANLATYQAGKGTMRFPHDQPLPLELVKRIVQYRAAQIHSGPAKAGPA